MSPLMIEYGDHEAKQLFQRFLGKGLLEKWRVGYAVPIPLMHTWLEKEYAREQIKSPEEAQILRRSGNGSSGRGFS